MIILDDHAVATAAVLSGQHDPSVLIARRHFQRLGCPVPFALVDVVSISARDVPLHVPTFLLWMTRRYLCIRWILPPFRLGERMRPPPLMRDLAISFPPTPPTFIIMHTYGPGSGYGRFLKVIASLHLVFHSGFTGSLPPGPDRNAHLMNRSTLQDDPHQKEHSKTVSKPK